MPQRKAPKVRQDDIDNAVSELSNVLDLNALSEVDRFFAISLLQDYGRWCGMSEAAWRSIELYGLTQRQTVGTKQNARSRMVKSEDIDIFKSATASKIALAAKISKFVASSNKSIEEVSTDDFDDFE